MIWSTKISPKVKLFLWRILSAALPVADQILRRGMSINPRCQICGEEGESINHVLFNCSVARQVWALSGVPTPEFGFQHRALFANIHFLFELKRKALVLDQIKKSWPWILWRLWKNRNKMFFESTSFCPLKSIDKIRDDVQEWFLAQTHVRNDVAEVSLCSAPSLPCWEPPLEGWVNATLVLLGLEKRGFVVGLGF